MGALPYKTNGNFIKMGALPAKRNFTSCVMRRSSLFVAQDRQANGCLHTNSFAGCKNMEREVRNVRVRNRVGVSLLDLLRSMIT